MPPALVSEEVDHGILRGALTRPEFCGFRDSEAEITAADVWLRQVATTVAPEESAVLVRTVEYGRARAALEEGRLEYVELVRRAGTPGQPCSSGYDASGQGLRVSGQGGYGLRYRRSAERVST
jgi:hypothetical protein